VFVRAARPVRIKCRTDARGGGRLSAALEAISAEEAQAEGSGELVEIGDRVSKSPALRERKGCKMWKGRLRKVVKSEWCCHPASGAVAPVRGERCHSPSGIGSDELGRSSQR